MSIVASCDLGWIISHEKYISKVYEGKYNFKTDLFNIEHPYKISKENCPTNLDPLAVILKSKFTNLIENIGTNLKLSSEIKNDNDKNNTRAKEFAVECLQLTIPLKDTKGIKGENNQLNTVIHNVNGCEVLFPKNCSFKCGEIKETMKEIVNEDFDLVVLDPPWWNKYIRRKNAKNPDSSYKMLYNEEITNLPVDKMLSSGSVVAVWCTNCKSHEVSIMNSMFPLWGVTYIATWFWIKITNNGDPVCPFTKTNGKQPYERVIIGIKDPDPQRSLPPDCMIFASVPSALHSHKPPLNDLLAPYIINENPKCLELFARYLLPDTLSLGLDALRWQHIFLYSDSHIRDDLQKNDNAQGQQELLPSSGVNLQSMANNLDSNSRKRKFSSSI
ncbi:methyltransferase like 4 [Arctopsyche grandis]|uniref:methyltransferase like 4 n=1 Tax=Arctopsyche grandis TaxID=121162 RepID=UPI00406D7BAC